MSSREEILEKIKKNKPVGAILPVIPDFPGDGEELEKIFEKSLIKNSGNLISTNSINDIHEYINKNYSPAQKICSLIKGIEGNVDIEKIADPHELKDLDLVILKGEFGVAENAAIWLSENTMGFRVLPFITQHLIMVLSKKDLVENMHLAYKKINLKNVGFGVFIAGPSKTADIEQNLVIGAHGSRSLTVFLMN